MQTEITTFASAGREKPVAAGVVACLDCKQLLQKTDDVSASFVTLPYTATATKRSAAISPVGGIYAVKNPVPVMLCHPAQGGEASELLGRGSAPSTPSGFKSHFAHAKPECRRMSIKKFFRVTPEENILLVTNAAEAGMEPSSYMRVQCLGKSKVRHYRRIRADWEELRRALGSINRLGNLINQLVRHLHRGGIPTNCADAALRELQRASGAVIEAVNQNKN